MFILILLLVLIILVGIFVQLPKFGKLPSGERLKHIQQSPHYKNGAFRNISETPELVEGVGYIQALREYFFEKNHRLKPKTEIPNLKTDLLTLSPQEDVLVWFGHSSYFIQLDGKKMLVDPVLSGSATPLPFGTKAFKGTDIYSHEDLPEIDYLFISHDHWDHLDYETVVPLKDKVKTVICGLGVGAHLERWGYDSARIIERDWFEKIELEDGFIVHTTPARHFTGRGFFRNRALWLSFVLQTPSMKIFMGGDSGYDVHFAEIGEKFGPFDLAILENGQYDRKWQYVHLLPDQILTVVQELKAKRVLPVHSGKFVLANHPWDEPLEKIMLNSEGKKIDILTPMIGESVRLKDGSQQFQTWWKNID